MSRSKHVEHAEQLDYWNAFREMPIPCMLIRADDPVFTIVDLNRAREEQDDIHREDFIGRSLPTAFPATIKQVQKLGLDKVLHKSLREVIRTGRTRSFRMPPLDIPGADGRTVTKYLQRSYIPLKDTSGVVTHIMAITQDMTSEFGEAQRTAEVENRLEAAMAIGSVGSWMWDLTSDVLVTDATMAKLFGVSADEAAKGVPFHIFTDSLHSEDRIRVEAAIRRAIKDHTLFEAEYRMVDAKAKLRWVIARAKLQDDHDGRRTFSGVIMDITERRDLQAQIELARKQDQLNRQAARVLQKRNDELEAVARTKDEFVALASHQLRTPATAVKQYLGMVLQGYVGDISDMQAEMLDKAFESNERQIQIINQILNAARVDTGRLVLTTAPVDLRSVVQGIANDMKSMFDAHAHTLKLVLPKHPVHIVADMGYLRMAIENIVNNAILYTPDGGVITLRLTDSTKRCKVVISDTGVGIRKSDLSKLFIKFSRIHNPMSVQAGGSGIGLYLAAEIVRLHSGTVNVDSEFGKGTSFAISLPLVQNTT